MLGQSIEFIHCDLTYNLALVKTKEESGKAEQQEQKQDVSKLRQRVTEYLTSSEEMLAQSPHPHVQDFLLYHYNSIAFSGLLQYIMFSR